MLVTTSFDHAVTFWAASVGVYEATAQAYVAGWTTRRLTHSFPGIDVPLGESAKRHAKTGAKGTCAMQWCSIKSTKEANLWLKLVTQTLCCDLCKCKLESRARRALSSFA